jgi:putative nucleotidyltransferase with HDIG domain
MSKYFKIDKELIIVFLLVVITGFIFFFVSNQRAFLNFFYLPVILGAYYFGKHYATQSAFFSVLLISLIAIFYPMTFKFSQSKEVYVWLDISTWGGFLIITGYLMGHLYQKKEEANKELKGTYLGIIEMMSLIIDSVDQYTQSHSYRVSIISEMMARKMGLHEREVEKIRVAALLHDLGKLGVSFEILNKAGALTEEERGKINKHARYGADVLTPVGGSVLDLLPIILNHHEKYDGSGATGLSGVNIPIGARILAVADVYDALVSDRPYRKALSPFEARKEIIHNSASQFDPEVLKAFDIIFPNLYADSPVFPSSSINTSWLWDSSNRLK